MKASYSVTAYDNAGTKLFNVTAVHIDITSNITLIYLQIDPKHCVRFPRYVHSSNIVLGCITVYYADNSYLTIE